MEPTQIANPRQDLFNSKPFKIGIVLFSLAGFVTIGASLVLRQPQDPIDTQYQSMEDEPKVADYIQRVDILEVSGTKIPRESGGSLILPSGWRIDRAYSSDRSTDYSCSTSRCSIYIITKQDSSLGQLAVSSPGKIVSLARVESQTVKYPISFFGKQVDFEQVVGIFLPDDSDLDSDEGLLGPLELEFPLEVFGCSNDFCLNVEFSTDPAISVTQVQEFIEFTKSLRLEN